MRKIKLISISVFSFLLTVVFVNSTCDRTDQIVEFEFRSGYQNIPSENPDYQDMQIIRGKFNPDSIAIHFKHSIASPGKEKREVNRDLELTGEEYQRYIGLVQNTDFNEKKIEEIIPGTPVFDVTLIDREGKSRHGTPSNQSDWIQFAQEIKQKATTP